MAMSLPAASPASSPAPQSPQSSADGSNGPSTPVSPSAVQTLALPPPVDATPATSGSNNNSTGITAGANGATGPVQQKRKPSRRANTAERRATHNAVERARRETLNGRFLDLAALLPNLSQIRRPSKSSIVNSSIAHIHASRRHRLLAARELRLLKLEADALRRELNEWRDRSGLPRIEEPVRGEGFQMIMSGEVEILSIGPIEEEGDGDEYGNDGYGDDGYDGAPAAPSGLNDDSEDMRHPHHLPGGTIMNAHGHNLHLQTILPRPTMNGATPSPMIVQSPTTVSFENPAMASMYDPPHMQPFYPSQEQTNKWHGGSGMFSGQQQFTPPPSAHGVVPSQQQQYVLNGYPGRNGGPGAGMFHAQQQQSVRQQVFGHAHGSPVPMDNDDASSVGSAGHSPVPNGMNITGQTQTKRERSGSMSSNDSGAGNFEMSSVLGGNGGPGMRRIGGGSPVGSGVWDEGMGLNMNGGMGMNMNINGLGGMGAIGMGAMAGGMGMGGRGANAAMSVGGGNAFAAMML